MAGQARELQQFADDDEAETEERKGFFARIDWDRVCAYKTLKVVRLQDRYMGMIYWLLITLVIMYTLIISFGIQGKHQKQEPGIGTVLTKIFGKAFSQNGGTPDSFTIFDPADLRFPVIEPSGAFILTKQTVLPQVQGKCVDKDFPKRCASGCDASLGESCGPDGQYCEVSAWCPSLGDTNEAQPPPGSKVSMVKGLDNMVMKIMSGIAFPGLGNQFFVTGGSPDGTNMFKNITVGRLLKFADPPIKVDEELLKSGALIGVSFFWNCDVSQDCEPAVVIKRLDDGQGFVQKRTRHYREGGIEKRDAIYLRGLRILVDSSGIGRKFSAVFAVMQIGSAIALMRVAGIIADYVMLYSVCMYSRTKLAAYYKCKVRETQDYTDLQDRLDLIQKAKDEPQLKDLARPGRASAGAHVTLGLGGGGRAGLASAVMRGRSNA